MSTPRFVTAGLLAFALFAAAGCSAEPAAPAPAPAPAPGPSQSASVLLPTPEPTEDDSVNTGNDMYGFDEKVKTSSGLSVEISKIDTKRTKSTVYFTFKVANGSKETWKGADTDVMVFYDGMNQADQVATSDKGIGGSLAAGKSRTATLGYKIPSSGFDEVTVQVTLSLDPEGTILYFDEIKS